MIIFDLDDTLYKEQQYVDSGICAVAYEAESLGVLPKSDAYLLIKNSPNVASGFDRLALIASGAKISYDVNRMLDIYRYHMPNISLSEETHNLLNTLLRRRVKLGIITDGRSATQRAKINALGLNKYVAPENILISAEIGNDKTKSTSFQLIMTRNPSETTFVYIGDNPQKDFYWPNKLGWQTIMLLDSLNVNIHTQQLTEAAFCDTNYLPQKTISSLREILNFI